ncbi:MAG TPA: hypothetical protein VFM37_01420 [Pseudonocardiaceae bacterium]|nr:hypothetical protein [Pseudonocardiaceae bacterium]
MTQPPPVSPGPDRPYTLEELMPAPAGQPPIAPGDRPTYALTDLMPAGPPRRRRVPWVLGAVAVLLVAGLVAAATLVLGGRGDAEPVAEPTSPTPDRVVFSVNGTFVLIDRDAFWQVGESCRGDSGFSDIQPGAQIVVTDPSGRTVGIGMITGGEALSISRCRFEVAVHGIPRGLGFYGIEITHRGVVEFAEQRLLTGGPVELSLGD